MKANPLLTIGEAASYLGVSRASLRRWSDEGLIAVHRTPGAQRRYSVRDLEAFIDSMRRPAGPRQGDVVASKG